MSTITEKNRIQNGGPKVSYEESLKIVNMGLWSDYRKKNGCLAKAAATPLPGPLLGAFMDKSIRVGDKDVCRIVPAHFFILQKIESKLLKLISMAQEERKSAVEMDAREEWEICHIFTQDPKRIFKLVRDGGVEALRKESDAIGVEWEPELIEAVILAVIEQLKRHLDTKVKLLSTMKDSGQISFFLELEKSQTSTKTV